MLVGFIGASSGVGTDPGLDSLKSEFNQRKTQKTAPFLLILWVDDLLEQLWLFSSLFGAYLCSWGRDILVLHRPAPTSSSPLLPGALRFSSPNKHQEKRPEGRQWFRNIKSHKENYLPFTWFLFLKASGLQRRFLLIAVSASDYAVMEASEITELPSSI